MKITEIIFELNEGQDSTHGLMHRLPSGTWSARDLRGHRTVSDPGKLIETSLPKGGRPLPVDYDHGSVVPKGNGSAAGWITELQARDNGIWGKVEWTEAGRKAVASREYRFISPVIGFDGNNKQDISIIDSAALTNKPALTQLISLTDAERSGAFGTIQTRAQADMDAIAALACRPPDAGGNAKSAEEAALDARLKEALGLSPSNTSKQG